METEVTLPSVFAILDPENAPPWTFIFTLLCAERRLEEVWSSMSSSVVGTFISTLATEPRPRSGPMFLEVSLFASAHHSALIKRTRGLSVQATKLSSLDDGHSPNDCHRHAEGNCGRGIDGQNVSHVGVDMRRADHAGPGAKILRETTRL
jgi:hypothetical protein